MKRQPFKPRVYLSIPPPLYIQHNPFKFNQTIINTLLPEMVPEIARACGLPDDQIVNYFDGMGGPTLSNPELFCKPSSCDYFHPNDEGHHRMAEIVYEALFGDNKGASTALTIKRPDKANVKHRQEMDEKNDRYEKEFKEHNKQFKVSFEELST